MSRIRDPKGDTKLDAEQGFEAETSSKQVIMSVLTNWFQKVAAFPQDIKLETVKDISYCNFIKQMLSFN